MAPKSWLYAVKKTRHACFICELNPDLVHPLTKLLYRLGYLLLRQQGLWLMPRMYCSLEGLLYSPYLPPSPRLGVPTFTLRYPYIHNDARDPSSERWNCVGENWLIILPGIATSMSIQGSFTCCKSATWDRRLYLPSKGRRTEDFFALKNPDGFGWI